MKTAAIIKSISAATMITLMGVSGAAFSADEAPHSNSVITAVTDAAITAKIKAKFMDDTRIKGLDINVTTANGAVTLSGSAPGHKESKAAEDMAKHVKGVVSVDNAIVTPSIVNKMERKTKRVAKKTERVASDSWITTKVKSALLADSLTKGFEISVKTTTHVVTLTGDVDTQAAIDQAIKLAMEIKGVASVDASNIKVSK